MIYMIVIENLHRSRVTSPGLDPLLKIVKPALAELTMPDSDQKRYIYTYIQFSIIGHNRWARNKW